MHFGANCSMFSNDSNISNVSKCSKFPKNPNVSTQTIQTIEMKRLIKRGGGGRLARLGWPANASIWLGWTHRMSTTDPRGQALGLRLGWARGPAAGLRPSWARRALGLRLGQARGQALVLRPGQ